MLLRRALLALLACVAVASCSPAPSSPDTHVYLDGQELHIAGICTRSQRETCQSLRDTALRGNPGPLIECNLDGGAPGNGRVILLSLVPNSVTFQGKDVYYVVYKGISGRANGSISGFAADRGVIFDLDLSVDSYPTWPHHHLFGVIRCP